MKKLLYAVLLSISLFLALPQMAQASQTGHILYEGYTDEGIHYTVYAKEFSQDRSTQTFATNYYQYVERIVYYDDYVTPPRTKHFAEYIHGHLYEGDLTLFNITQTQNRTLAEYHGKLYIRG